MSDSLGDRMKIYEKANDSRLVPHVPFILRVDGKSFHSYTKGCEKPYDKALFRAMLQTTCDIRNQLHYIFAYGQSDEVSFLFYYPDTKSQSPFDGRVDKLCSIMASAFTWYFSKLHDNGRPALFDCRAFNIPFNEINNYFIWRQQDAVRNSIQMIGHANFSPKQLHGKTCNQIQDMLFKEKEINWNNVEPYFKRGWGVSLTRGNFGYINVPTFTENRLFIESLMHETYVKAHPELKKEISFEDMQKLVDANEKLVKDLKDAKD
jgi:tRNA(His) 5'-end guanylyltransferase